MSRVRAGSHVIISGALLCVLVPAALLSLWHTRLLERKLEDSLLQYLVVLKQLPELRSGVRRVDLLTELYLSDRGAEALKRRNDVAAQVLRRYEELMPLCAQAALPAQCGESKRLLDDFLTLLDAAILARADASGAVAAERRRRLRDRRDALLESITVLDDAAADELMRRLDAAQRELRRAAVTRLLLESAAAFALVFLLYALVLRPIARMDKSTGLWRLGEPWRTPRGRSIPELGNLSARFADMAGRLNGQFLRERERSEFKTGLISVVSHEFVNALTIIKNAAFLLHETLPAESAGETEPYFEIIEANITALSGEALNVLSVGRAEAGKLAVDTKPLDPREILKAEAGRMRLLAERKKVSVSLELPDGALQVLADPATLGLAVSNLLGNAIKYTPPQGCVTAGVRAERGRPGRCRLYVRDTGIGFSPQEKERILGGHYRTEEGRRMTAKGFGIGLALARQIIEAHGSALEVQSRPGEGSEFSFVLPLLDSEPAGRHRQEKR